MLELLGSVVLSGIVSWGITRAYYTDQLREARLSETAAQSRHDQLLREMLRVSDVLDPDEWITRTSDVVTTKSGEPVTAQGAPVTVRNLERLADFYAALDAPEMADVVRKAAELDRYESMTLEEMYCKGLIEPDPSYRR